MMLREILKDCDSIERLQEYESFMDIDVSGVAYDSRSVQEGYIFVAMKGERSDGHDFIKDAIEKGALVVAAEREPGGIVSKCLLVKDGRKTLACISNNFYGRPSERLVLTGVTGTNGKTTTTYLLKSILESQGKYLGLIGTIQYMIKDRVYPARHTTPESPEFQSLLRDMLMQECTHVVSEVSSHALAQHRVDNTVFHAAVFTNLTRDHLDFHKTMEDYFRAKEKLFIELLHNDGTAVINSDDPYGRRLDSQLRALRPELNILTYGTEPGADITASDIEVSFRGLRFNIAFRGERYGISSPLAGIPNVYNILSAAGAAIALCVPWQDILEGIRRTSTVSGRFERIETGQNFLCIIDYAHTEDALERLIQTARELIKNSAGNGQQPKVKKIRSRPSLPKEKQGGLSHRVITVFGCGGDRDRGKRPKMGAVATRLSDFVIITSDNPRSENPSAIIKDIEDGAVRKNYLIEPDRKEAIRRAVEMAVDGDIVLIAGKGHEDYQEIQGARYPFSDRRALQDAIDNTRRGRDVQ